MLSKYPRLYINIVAFNVCKFLDVMWIMNVDEVVDSTECRGDVGLDFHAIFRSKEEDAEAVFQDPKDVLDDIAC